jgi:hypothetical protein
MLRHQLFVYFLRNSVNHSFKKLPGAVEATFGRCQKRFQKNTFLCLSAAPRRRVQRHSAERRSAERHSPQLRHSPEAFCRMPAFGAVPPSAVLRDAARLNVAASCLLAMKNSHHFETFPRSEQNNSFRVKSNKKEVFLFFDSASIPFRELACTGTGGGCLLSGRRDTRQNGIRKLDGECSVFWMPCLYCYAECPHAECPYTESIA